MMMSKPAPEKEQEDEKPPAFAAAPSSKTGSVEDLERRLKMLGTEEEKTTSTELKPPPPATVVTAPPSAPEGSSASVGVPLKGGKNALLARIMAAKEKSQQSQQKVAPAPPKDGGDLLMDFDAPVTQKDAPPPSYDTNFLAGMAPPPMEAASSSTAPPAFGAVENTTMQAFPPPPPIDSVMPPPPSMENVMPPPPPSDSMDLLGGMMAPAPAASAPSFEDLLGGTPTQQDHPPALPPPPPQQQQELDIDESILNALEPAEREAFLEEQRKIMEQIEKNKSGNEASGAAARAAAFDQRSSAAVAQVAASYETGSGRATRSKKSSSKSKSRSSNSSGTVNLGEGQEVPLHGQEKTQQAIKDGTAVIVQCMSCNNWMQVTEAAELMFCPICQVVCPVQKAGAASADDMEAAAQLAADAELAEKLQKEEYARAGGGGEGGASARRRRQQQQQQQQAASSGDQSWYDWLTGAPAPAPAAASRSAATSGGGHSAETRPQRGLVAATTGEEGGVGRSRSYDESEGLIGGGGGARVAESKSMFACVADSVATAATQMTAYTLSEDPEGNVHGVDSSSLLAMPDVSRPRDNNNPHL